MLVGNLEKPKLDQSIKKGPAEMAWNLGLNDDLCAFTKTPFTMIGSFKGIPHAR